MGMIETGWASVAEILTSCLLEYSEQLYDSFYFNPEDC